MKSILFRRVQLSRTLHLSRLGAALSATALVAATGIAARADVLGRLHIVISAVADKKPIAGAKVTLHDSAGVRPDITLTTGEDGSVTSPLLENRAWKVTVDEDKFEENSLNVTVAADTTTETAIALAPAEEKSSTVKITRPLVTTSNTSNSAHRDQNFIEKFPATAGNPQSLKNLLITDPGFVQDSVNQVHPRGEHSATSIYIDGFRLPGAFQGRAGQVLLPETIQSLDAQTGGFAPEYGGETAAILNVNLKAGTIKPFSAVSFEGGSYNTYNYGLTFGGQAGAPIHPGDTGDNVAKKFGYLIDYSGRTTDNALEAPQPDNQTAHNHGVSQSIFGNFGYTFDDKNNITLTLEDAPAQTQIANRTGLSSKYAPVGEGYGFGGARNSDGTLSGSDDSALGGETEILKNQEQAGQDIYQEDENRFGILNFHHTFSDTLTGLISVGATSSRLDILNHNPAAPDLSSLPDDSSIEYNPTLKKKSSDTQIAANITKTADRHTYKAGFLIDQQSGSESYLLQPGSQFALDALFAADPLLAPQGSGEVDASGNAVLDALGYQIYNANAGAVTPTAYVHRTGHYDALYVQDTWHATKRLTANYGLRLDDYQQTQTVSESGQDDISNSVSKTFLSPRINLAYGLTPKTIGRLSYNKLFIQPPLAQGGQVGDKVLPETYDDYNASIERQLGSNQTAKLSYYYKNESNEIDTNLLIAGTQIGAFTSVNLERGAAHGVEFSYDMRPLGPTGFGAYASYAYSIDRPEGVDSQGGDLTGSYNDHDTRHSLSAGVDYTFADGINTGLTGYFSSGTESSILGSLYNDNTVDGGKRQARTEFNYRLESPGVLNQHLKVAFEVQNLFNSLQALNFNSGFTGTRFQQGRRFLLGFNGYF